MSSAIRAFVSGACNAFRSDGYARSAGSYRALGQTATRIHTKRAAALRKNIRVTDAKTAKLGK